MGFEVLLQCKKRDSRNTRDTFPHQESNYTQQKPAEIARIRGKSKG